MTTKRVHLHVIPPDEPVVAFREGVPTDRDECPDTSVQICPWIRCRFHLLMVTAENRAGRPSLRKCQRDENGFTLSQPGDLGDERESTFEPRYIGADGELQIVPSCTLDEVLSLGRAMTNEEIGGRLGRHRTLVARQAKVALEKFVLKGKEWGIEPEDLLGALIQMGEEQR
jgi:hypothetical protein